jgi:mono/diheme cytochrome c family protein
MRSLAIPFVVLASILLPASASRADDTADPVKRGEYLARAGDCVACHTAPGGKPFAGGAYMPTPFGEISVPNITADRATGIGGWTDDQFFRAMHEGIGKDGEYLYPVFPFPWYTRVTRDDALAIKAYLFSLPPENAPRKPLKLAFPFNVREALVAWRTLFFKPGEPQTDTSRGAYLVEGLGHCGECHNKRNVLGASQWSGRLEGGAIEGWYAPNITSDGRQGIGTWSEDALASFLKTGMAPGKGVVLGPMQETITESLRYLSDDDLHAIAAYLRSVPAEETRANDRLSAFDASKPPGSQAYLSNCAACHRLDGTGVVGMVPALAGNGAVLAQGPQNVVKVILGGLPASHGLAPMPAVGVGMTDQDIADVVDYVRNSWGNAVPTATGAGLVGQLRSSTATLLAGNPPDGCPPAADPVVARVLDAGAAETLGQASPATLLPAIDDALAKVKKAAPSLGSDDTVNALTAAYCRGVVAGGQSSQAEREARIGNFAVLVYSQIKAPVQR